MSRNRIPGLGKSGISRISFLSSSTFICGISPRAIRQREQARLLVAGVTSKGDPGGLVGTRQIGERIAREVVAAHLEVQIRAGGAPARADAADDLAARDRIALAHQVLGVVPIDRDVMLV